MIANLRRGRRQDQARQTSQSAQTVLRAAHLLNCFSEERPEWSVSELSRELGLNLSTVSRLLGTMESMGFLARDGETGKFQLGPRIIGLAYVSLSHLKLRRLSMAILQELSDQTALHATLAVLHGSKTMYIARVEASDLFRGNYALGREIPLYCTAVGKVLMAFSDPEQARKLLSEQTMAPLTPNTIVDAEKLLAQLDAVRNQGTALDWGEFITGIGCVAGPVREHTGGVVAAVGVSGPLDRLEGRLPEVTRRLIEASNKISFTLGYTRAFV